MAINNISSTNSVSTLSTESSNSDSDLYSNLNDEWNKYNDNQYLSSDLKNKIDEQLAELKNLIDTNEEENNNEEIAESIANLTAILNGNDSMMGMADRIKCLEALDKYKVDLNDDTYDFIYSKLNDVKTTYAKQEDFYKDFYSGVLEKYSDMIGQSVKNSMQKSINEGSYNKDNNADIKKFYKELFNLTLEQDKGKLKSKDYTSLLSNVENDSFALGATFFNKLSTCLVSYVVYQDNVSTSSRSNLANNTISMQVMKAANAYRMLDLDNLMSEELNKRAEMDPAMKRLRDGNYWADNKEIDHHKNVRPEDELWTKKPE